MLTTVLAKAGCIVRVEGTGKVGERGDLVRVKSIDIKNGFKRFTELQVGPLPESARLVMLLGSNGSGKSSFLESMLLWHFQYYGRHRRRVAGNEYYERPAQGQRPEIAVDFYGSQLVDPIARKRAFHFRSAYRYTSDFRSNNIGQQQAIEDQNPIDTLIEEDHSVAEHYARLVGKSVAAFADLSSEVTNTEVYATDVRPLADSFTRLFPDLQLTGIGDPTLGGTFLFTKFGARDFLYMNLSSGEKAAFDLLLDLHIRKTSYPESVICLDEPEAHLGVGVQGKILDEMLTILPAECQLWIATHSIGMMRRAFEIALLRPGDVVFLDFDGRDYEVSTQILPSEPTRALWQKVHSIAFEDLAALVAPDVVYICEGDPAASTESKMSFDATVLKTIFGDQYPGVDFVSVGGVTVQPGVAHAITALMSGTTVRRVMDRDGRTDKAIEDLKSNDSTVCVLSVRDLENYLLADEILQAGCEQYAGDQASEAFAALLAKKTELLASQTYDDDVKEIAGSLFELAKKLWKLNQPGQDRHEFMRDVCAPLVSSGTQTYGLLRNDLQLPC